MISELRRIRSCKNGINLASGHHAAESRAPSQASITPTVWLMEKKCGSIMPVMRQKRDFSTESRLAGYAERRYRAADRRN